MASTQSTRLAPEQVAEGRLREVGRSHNLRDEHWDRIVKILGRQPTVTEVGIFGVMWSEHCCYGSSKIYLRTMPTKGPRVLVPAGKENAGLIDVGHGLALAFKVESHNHPSAVEPHAGAATGVGGIIRDIFTMGARPIALLDSLRFGSLNGHARTKFLVGGVVKGIADYGNAVGIPTVGGEIYFDDVYRENPLVNVMCIGLVPKGKIARGAAKGVGNPVIYVGSSTGRDGLGGASFASREISSASEAERPAVQIGDPFTEKCLIEATLEALATGDVVGIQDMGAAGLTCSTCEMPARGGTGMEIDVANVPRREQGMTPYDVMLSESQERMLLVVKRGRQRRIIGLFAKWNLHAVEIGHVTGDGMLHVKDQGVTVARIPAKKLADQAPVYRRPVRRPAYLSKAQRLSLAAVRPPKDFNKTLLKLVGSPTIANKAFVYEQYDHMVQTNTVVLPGRADASVLRLKGTGSLLAVTIDGNGTYCYLDPFAGGQLAVAEAARNIACTGATPLAVTDCLNFGNPEDPEVMWQFRECVRGISAACRAFGTPVTGGNVSLYNESPSGAIDPTPIIGMVGLIEAKGPRLKAEGSKKTKSSKTLQPSAYSLQPMTASFKDEGDLILLLGTTREELGGSEYLKVIHQRKQGKPSNVDLTAERRLQRLLIESIGVGLVKSAHDCAEGGLLVTLAECCMMDHDRQIGAAIEDQPATSIRADAWLFGESAGRAIVTCEAFHRDRLLALARKRQVPCQVIGRVGGRRLSVSPWIDLPIDELQQTWRQSLARHLGAA